MLIRICGRYSCTSEWGLIYCAEAGTLRVRECFIKLVVTALGLKGKGGVYSVDKIRNGIFDRGTNMGMGAEGLQVVCNCWILRWDRAGTVGVEAGDLIGRPCQGVAFGEGAERF